MNANYEWKRPQKEKAKIFKVQKYRRSRAGKQKERMHKRERLEPFTCTIAIEN